MEIEVKKRGSLFPAVTVLIGICVLILLAISSAPPIRKSSQKQDGAQATAAPLDKPNVDFSNPTRGPKTAKVTLVLFSDYLCPACVQFELVLDQVMQAYPEDVRLVWKDFPNDASHPGALTAAIAARCADLQGAFWEYHDLLMSNQGSVSEEGLNSMATALALNEQQFSQCLSDSTSKPLVERDFDEGQRLRVEGTPYLFINGRKSYGAVSFDMLKGLVEAELTAVTKAEGGATK